MNNPRPQRQRSCLGRILLYLLVGYLVVSLLGGCSARILRKSGLVPSRELVFRVECKLPGERLIDAVVPDNHTLLTLTGDRILRTWDLDSASQRTAMLLDFLPLEHPDWALSPDGRLIAGHGALWEVASERRLLDLEPDTTLSVESFAFDANGRTLYGGTFEGPVLRWDTSTGHRLPTLLEDAFEPGPVQFLTGRNAAGSLAFSPDGRRMAVGTYSGDLTILRQDGKKASESLAFQMKDPCGFYSYLTLPWAVSCLAFTPDGEQLIAGGSNGSLYVWDARTGKNLGVIRDTPADRLLITPDGKAWIILSERHIRFYHINDL